MNKMVWAFLITFSILFTFSLSNSQAQQVWTYDFGDATGSFTSGDEINPSLLPATQTGGGDTRLRIGGGNEIIFSDTDNDIGTFSRMIIQGSPSDGQNLFVIGSGDFEPTEIFYLRANIEVNANLGQENDFLLLIENIDGFNSNGSNVSNSSNLAGIQFQIRNNAITTRVRRYELASPAWNTTGDFGANVVDLGDKFVIEIYFNNSIDDLFYYRDGQESTLLSGHYAVFIDGIRKAAVGSSDAQANDLTESAGKVGMIRFGGGIGDNDTQIEIDEIVYSNSLPDIRTVEGVAGWRMLALPYDTPVEQLARQNMIQGITDGDFTGAGANIFISHSGAGEETSEDSDWSAPENINTLLNRGQGFIWGLYDNADVLQSKPLPMDLTITGTQTAGDVTVSLSDANDGWNLLGNPFSQDLDVSNLGNWAQNGSFESATVQIYDPATDSYILSTNNDNKVASFQGFFLQNDDAEEIEFPATAASIDDATFYKQQDERRLISFNISAIETNTYKHFVDRAFNLIFTEQSVHEWDLWDTSKLTPFSDKYIGMAFIGERYGEPRLKAQESRPFDLQQSVSVPVEFYSTGVIGTAELSVQHIENIPADWTIEIEDTQTGIRQVLTEEQPFTFDFSATQQAKERQGGVVMAVPAVSFAEVSDESPRFVMHISPREDVAAQLPDNFTLHQNYPNPFNPTTVISYELPQVADVQLQVFDMLGRQVATLVEGRVQAGTHQVTFDASNLSSGVYIYRLHTSEHVLTRKLTVLK